MVGQVPASWKTMTLGDACALGGGAVQTGPFGSQLHASDYVEAGVPSIMPVNIGDNRIVENGIARVREEDARRLARHRVKPGDIVYSRRGDVERRALVRESEDGWLCGTGCLRVRLGDGHVDPAYASYYLGHPNVRQWIVRHAQGATMPNLNTAILSALPFVVPPLDEQRRIAGNLGALDDKIELLRRMSDTLRAVCAEAYNQVAASALLDATVGDVAEVIDCLHAKKPERRDTGKPLLQLNNIGDDGVLDLADVYSIDESDYRRWTSRVEASPGDCVITNVGRVGAVAQLPAGVRAALGRNMTCVRPRADFPYPTVLLEALLSPTMRDEIARKTDTGTILDALNVRSIPRLRIPLPGREELDGWERRLRPFRARMEACLAEQRTLARARDALLPRLLSGEMALAA